MLIVVAAGIFGLLVTSRTAAYQSFRHYLVSLAEAASTTVDPVLQNEIRRPEQLNDADYVRAVEPLRRLRRTVPDIHYVYTFTSDGRDVRFVLDAADPGAKSVGGVSDQSGVWEIYEHRSPAMMLVLGNGHGPGVASATTEQVTDEWGTFMTGFAPIFDAGGHQIGAVGVDVDASVFLARLKAARNRALLGLIPAGILIALLGSVFYRIRLRSLADVAAREAMEAALLEAAQQDKLTGLPNREAFMERLGQTLLRVRAGKQLQFAVLFLDFDRFKLINDTLGHEAGDELLRQISRRLQGTLRASEAGIAGINDVLISRFGGDEFLILIDDVQGARNVIRVSEHLLEALAPAYNVFSSEVHSMASVGIVIGDPISSNSTADEIVRNADVAMYEAKRAGRGCSVVFNAGMHARLTRHLAIETSLRRALGSDELYLEYQPIVDLRSGRRLYVEALARWKHPTMGLISPSEFIPIAEESGLIVAVGQWVLERACRAMIEWRALDPQNAPAMVSVNLSRAEIALGNRLLEQVQTTLEAVGLPPECLQLEVTEREVMRNPEAARELLGKLRQFGVRLAMDDFGTGTSSLSLLRAYPFNTIKIDRSFLQDLNTSHEVLAVIHATVNLIGNLEMVSLAEGVEDASQVAILRSLGCRYAQGYFFSRPVPADRLLEAMEEAVLPAAGQVRVIQR
ncbi:MAG: domain S-box/diguanylate cyclase protein [Gammaproteobacteria bacterium]|nr:domain S-box/diguanylate cyclase protein [Gammaproteobacteria bacterium]